jgi:hypothetical protein
LKNDANVPSKTTGNKKKPSSNFPELDPECFNFYKLRSESGRNTSFRNSKPLVKLKPEEKTGKNMLLLKALRMKDT